MHQLDEYFSIYTIKNVTITRIPVWVIVICIILVLLISSSGFLNLYFLNESHQEIEKINEITSLTQTTQIEFEKQLSLLHYMILENDPEEFRKYFHQFSYQYTYVQNNLFNLKILLVEYPTIQQNIAEIIHYHKQFSELLIDEITQYKENKINASDVYSIIKGKDQHAIDLLVKTSNHINTINYNNSIRTKNKYYIFSMISIGLISSMSIVLVIMIVIIIQAEKRFLVSIGKNLSAYLPTQLVQMLLHRQKQEIIPLQKKFITVCFTDIQGFTKLTDTVDIEIAADILNEYLSVMTKIAHKYDATIDKFLGDGIMIVFGAPISMTPALQTDNAIQMSIEMLRIFKELHKKWQSILKHNSLHLRIGIHCGVATVGSFGPQERLTFTAIGKIVNIASRLEQMCPEDSILISSEVKKLAPHIKTTNPHNISLKGIEQPVEVYSVEY